MCVQRKRVKKEEIMEVNEEINCGGKKREKKTFTMPGQKRDPPDEVLLYHPFAFSCPA